MTTLTTNPTRPAISAHRARIVGDAVISAYIRELAPPRRPVAASTPISTSTSIEATNERPVAQPSARTHVRERSRFRPLRRARASWPCPPLETAA